MNDHAGSGAWLLTSRSDARDIAAALERIDQHLAAPESVRKDAVAALHTLHSGLHATDVVPEDVRREVRS